MLGPTSGRMNELILIKSRGSIVHGFCLRSSFVSGTAIAMFVCYSFCHFPHVYRTECVSMRFTISFYPDVLSM